MASCSRKLNNILGVVVATIIMLAVAAVVAEARPSGTSCDSPEEYVFSYGSFCLTPATLETAYHYKTTTLFGALEPEWDDSNSTYYVRLSDASEGANYVAIGKSSDRGVLLTNSTVYIVNAATSRALQWRQEGSNEFFLIEQEVSSPREGAPFRFLKADGISLPCPLVYPPAQCNAYYVVSDPTASSTFPSTGLLAYHEAAGTYIKNAPDGSVGDLPILLLNYAGFDKPPNTLPFLARRTATH